MLGLYENFPQTIHLSETYASSLSKQKTQVKLTEVFQALNHKTFSFEETGNPTMPNCSVIFEFGIADAGNFNFLSETETKKLQSAVAERPLRLMDWFCVIRYYKNTQPKKTPMKFDYYMLRSSFMEAGLVHFQVFHERGPRYISPENLLIFIVRMVNKGSKTKMLMPTDES